MALFRRGTKDAAHDEVEVDPSDQELGTEDVPEPEPDDVTDDEPGEPTGPWDASQVPPGDGRLDLGGMRLAVAPGAKVHMETKGQVVTLVRVELDGSELQLAPFAAPRSEGIWDEIREEIAQQVTSDGGTVDDLPGPFGRELLARVVVRTAEGRTGQRVVRFIGADGPRWFLRGVITGRATTDAEAAAAVEQFFAGTVVVRGTEAMPPREPLALQLPGQVGPAPVPEPAPVDPFARGPEITEIR
ncbi:DUF3710 domain-containing protein [Cellulomonas citrea]|uniref:DUF3710 domain-containing protein n=1 Tax=Cellulomonas citrea TaxID=1909423 RepID=UPI00135A35F8|nr:DUF3710 domain-containing protein [Cellulomonas citrea]